MISSHSKEPVANFNIANLYKNAEEFSPNNCTIFRLIALKLRPGRSKMWKHKKLYSLRGAIANFNNAQTNIFLHF